MIDYDLLTDISGMDGLCEGIIIRTYEWLYTPVERPFISKEPFLSASPSNPYASRWAYPYPYRVYPYLSYNRHEY